MAALVRLPRAPRSRVQPRFLRGSRWTALVPLADTEGECHFEVVAVTRAAGTVTLRAVLTSRTYELARTALDDAGAWALGWQSRPPAADP